MTKTLIILALLAMTTTASAETLQVGRTQTIASGTVTTPIAIKNDTSEIVRRVYVECGHLAKDELVGAGFAIAYNIEAGDTGYVNVPAFQIYKTPDQTKCRIVKGK